ncbi:hypothetical protein JCM8547_006107 [Rhodosporidiobolus lusitaniae]
MSSPSAFPSFPSLSAAPDTPPVVPQPLKKRPYATSSARAFSRSALARQSVHTLPSIKHLQHGFAQLALANEQQEGKPRTVADMVGGPMSEEEKRASRRRSRGWRRSIAEQAGDTLDEEEEEVEGEGGLGPAPAAPERDDRMPWEKEGGVGGKVKGVDELREEVLEGMEEVCDRWGLISHLIPSSRPRSRLSNPSSSSRRLSSISTSSSPSRASSPSLFLQPGNLSTEFRPLSPFSDLTDPTSAEGDDGDKQEIPLVLDLLSSTTLAIRRVQAYVVALPSSTFAPPPSFSSSALPLPLGSSDAANLPSSPTSSSKHDLELPYLRISTAARPRTSLTPVAPEKGQGKGKEAENTEGEEPEVLRKLRRKSLEVLGMLRELEGRYRLQPPSSSGPAAGDRSTYSTPLPSPSFPSASSSNPALTSAPEYAKEGVTLDDVLEAFPSAEQALGEWVEAVGGVLAAAGKGKGERRKGRRTSWSGDGEEEEEAQKEDMPEWAKEGAIQRDGLALAHSLLLSHAPHLPSHLTSLLPPYPLPSSPSTRTDLLTLLSTGELLCHAYNAVLRHSSSRGFGFISQGSIHSVPAASQGEGEEGGGGVGSVQMGREGSQMSTVSMVSEDGKGEGKKKKVGRTFRRVENLGMWAAALKFRYSLPLVLPSPTSSSSTPPSLPPNAIPFDPRLITSLRPGWEAMLEKAIRAWGKKVRGEWREENGFGEGGEEGEEGGGGGV